MQFFPQTSLDIGREVQSKDEWGDDVGEDRKEKVRRQNLLHFAKGQPWSGLFYTHIFREIYFSELQTFILFFFKLMYS